MTENTSILVVDDDAAVREAYKEILALRQMNQLSEGDQLFGDGEKKTKHIPTIYQIEEAKDGIQAIQKVRDTAAKGRRFAAAFVDMKMPGMNGAETAREIWRIDPCINIMIVTAYSDVAPDEMVEAAGREDLFYLRKPFNPQEIRQCARAMCRLRALEQERDALAGELREVNRSLATMNRHLEDKVKVQAKMLIQMDKMASLGQHAAELIHDLRNPLSVVRSSSQLCLESMKLDRLLKKHFEVIDRNARRACVLINEVMAFAKTGTPKHEAVELNEMIEASTRRAREFIGSEGCEFKCELGRGLPPVIGDADQLSRCFLNLIVNGVESLAGHGVIALRTRLLESQACVEACVMDNGPGIAEEHRDKIFQPFFTTKKQGTGLGLSIAHSVVTQHGGSIAIEPRERGGVKVCVTLPVKAQEG
jgi:two-component system, NtrC family, sensor kinase